MNTAYHTTTTVLPGHRIEITAPNLKEGDRVQVVVIPAPGVQPSAQKRSGLEVIESYTGPGLFGSVEEIDRYINEERDSWER